MATHSSILAWEILWTEEPGGLQPMGWQRVRHDSDWARTHTVISKRGGVRPGLSAFRIGVLWNHLAEAGRSLKLLTTLHAILTELRLLRPPVFTGLSSWPSRPGLFHTYLSVLDSHLTSHPWFSMFCLFCDLPSFRTSCTLYLLAPYIKNADKYKSEMKQNRWNSALFAVVQISATLLESASIHPQVSE